MVIYKITNIINGKVLIGQTIYNPPIRRWYLYRFELNRNRYNNKHLQASWNKYGEDSFRFEIIDTAQSLEELNEKECSYIREYCSDDGDIGYNMRPGGANGGPATEAMKARLRSVAWKAHTPEIKARRKKTIQKSYAEGKIDVTWAKTYPGLIAPDGTEHRAIHSLKTFATKLGMNHNGYNKLREVALGQIPQYKGWRHIDYGMPGFGVPTYKGKRPGERLELDEEAHAEWLTDIKRKTGKKNSKKWVKTYPALVDSNGIVYPSGENLAEFCRKQGLNRRAMTRMVFGERKSYKGWTVKK